LLALGAVLVMAPEAPASILEYLHVEANAGSSAGGHFALRLDDWVYDFQNAELGTLRLRRTDYDLFRYLYTVLENRTMHIARIDVPRKTHEEIFDRFNRRYLIQNKQFSMLDSLREDRELIRLLLTRGSDAKSPEGDRVTPLQGDRETSFQDNRAQSPGADPATPPEREWNGMRIRGAGFFYDDRRTRTRGEKPLAGPRAGLGGGGAPGCATRIQLSLLGSLPGSQREDRRAPGARECRADPTERAPRPEW
jgi:hypothetical protein